MIDMKLTRQYFDVKDVRFGDKCALENGVLTVNEAELQALTADLCKAVKGYHLEITKPGENARIIHVLDTIAPMVKIEGEGVQYSGFFSTPYTVGRGVTNMLSGFAVIESAALPWDESNASSGLLYPRDAIIELSGFYAGYTPFSKTNNLVIIYDLNEGKSSIEYDNDIRLIAIRISNYLAELTRSMTPDRTEEFSTEEEHPELPGVVMVWQCQNQGPYADTMLYGMPIDDMVPTVLHPNEMLDGCVVSGNYVWPAFKVPTYLHVNHPVLLELYRRHGKDINFKGVIFCRSHNPSTWHKQRCASHVVKLAQMPHGTDFGSTDSPSSTPIPTDTPEPTATPAPTACLQYRPLSATVSAPPASPSNSAARTAQRAYCWLMMYPKLQLCAAEVQLRRPYTFLLWTGQ